MGIFKGDLVLKKYTPYSYKLVKPISYTTNKGKEWIVPIGFLTDGASIPKIAWSIVGSPLTGRYTKAAVVHDQFYALVNVKRSYADKIFLEAMKELKVGWLKRKTMYWAVRLYSWTIWNKRKKKLKND